MSKKFAFLKTVATPDAEDAVPEAGAERDAAPKWRTAKTAAAPARRGRPPGKRSNPDFEQVTIYIRKSTHQNAKVELLKGGKRQEFSELVEVLVKKWLQ